MVMGGIVTSRAIFDTTVPGYVSISILGLFCWAKLVWSRFVLVKTTKGTLQFNTDTIIYRALRGRVWLLLFLSMIILSSLWSAIMAMIVVPDDWDAWAIWGAKAKVLALGHGPLLDVSHFGHEDYPLLWPAIWSYAGWLNGGWEEVWARGWGTVFYILCIWELVVIIYRMTHRVNLSILAGALFASMPVAPLVTSWSYAEAPFWLMTTTCVGYILHMSASSRLSSMFIPALLAAGAAYTKNEGVMFALLIGFWIIFVIKNNRVQCIISFLLIFFMFYFPWIYWTKIVMEFGSHATAGLQLDMDNLYRVLGRLMPAKEAIGRIWFDIKLWNIVLVGGITSMLTSIVRFRADCLKLLLLPVAILIGYFLVTVFHYAEIYWQIGTSWNRLTLHAMPFIILVLTLQLDESETLKRLID